MPSADTVATTAAPQQYPEFNTGTSVMTTAAWLCLLLGVIFLAYYLLKKFGFSGGFASGPGSPRLVSRLMLGNRQSVAVVRYRDRDLILGVTDSNITLLKDEEANPEVAPAAGPGKTFASLLRRKVDNEEAG